MSDSQVIDVPEKFAEKALLDERKCDEVRDAATKERLAFWHAAGQNLEWIKTYTEVCDVSFKADDLHIKWYKDGSLNASFNCLDRHLQMRGSQIAIVWVLD